MDESTLERYKKAVDLYDETMAKKNAVLGRKAMMSGIIARQDLIDSGKIDDATKKAYRQWIDETMAVLAEPLEKNIAKAAPAATVDAEGRLKLPPRTPSTPKPSMSVEAVPVKPNRAQMEKMFEEIMARDAARAAAEAEKNIVSPGSAGKGLRGLGKVAGKLLGPISAGLTAFDLAAALAEARKLGEDKIGEEYTREQLQESARPEFEAARAKYEKAGYTPEERMRLKEMLKQLRGSPGLRQ